MINHKHTQRLFEVITQNPKWVLAIGLLLIVITAGGLPRLVKDTSVEAFIPAGHPALLANEQTAELFGLTDAVAVALFTEDSSSVFQPQVLALAESLVAGLEQIETIRSDRIISIVTESSIAAADDAIAVDPYFDEFEPNYTGAEARWRMMPPHISTLVSDDASATVIMAELVDSYDAPEVYQAVNDMIAALPTEQTANVQVMVAGPAAVSGYLSDYIDADARVLQPIIFLVVLVFLYLAFRRVSSLLGPVLVLLGSAGGAIGVMAWLGIPYFAITNALPVILVAISVADAIHVLSAYFELRLKYPERDVGSVVVTAMQVMVRPITLTTLTTIAGFIGIGLVSIMPPITYFAWFAALGVALAWLYSLFVLPAVLVLMKTKPSRRFSRWQDPTGIAALMTRLTLLPAKHPMTTLAGFIAVVGLALVGASNLRIDRSQVENFASDEPIRIADEQINKRFAGTAFLDVIVSHSEEDGLLTVEHMEKIRALQSFLEQQPHVTKTVSIVDYLSLLHTSIEGLPADQQRQLPDSDAAIAQYLMVYEASGDPTDLEEEITADYQAALVRAVLNTPLYSDSQPVVEALERYLDDHFGETLQATVAGDVNLTYHWMEDLRRSHFIGVALSLGLILIMSIVVFRSFAFGLLAVIPVSFTVLCLYAVMGMLAINLEVATSMFAAISVGVGVDFAIHLIERLRRHHDEHDGSAIETIRTVVPSTARACFFNAAALGVGFAVLMISDLPTLQRFGGLVSVAAFVSFVTALILVPGMFALRLAKTTVMVNRSQTAGVTLVLAILAGTFVAAMAQDAHAIDGETLAQRVAERPEADAAIRHITMTLTNRKGKVRSRDAVVLRLNQGEARDTRVTYLTPNAVRELTFLSRDYRDADRTDLRWLYIPATRKVRRIPASDRGDYFLGTDFTFEDMRSDLKFDPEDYQFDPMVDSGDGVLTLTGQPKSTKIARQLGYGRFRAEIQDDTWFPLQIEFFDLRDRPLKTIRVDGLRQIEGIWTPTTIEAEHHQTGHRTHFEYVDVQHPAELPATHFESQSLSRGMPASW